MKSEDEVKRMFTPSLSNDHMVSLWIALHNQIMDDQTVSSSEPYDPLSPSERKLFEALTLCVASRIPK